MAITNLNELCRLCLEPSEMLYKLDSDFCILVMESGASVTISDAMSYLAFDIKVVQEKADTEDPDEAEDGSENGEIPDVKPVIGDAVDEDTNLPKSLCQECLEKLQSAYEFKFRCEENRNFLRNYLKECADSKLAEEKAAKDAAFAALDIDIDNIDSLPDKLVLKDLKKEKKPRKPRDPAKPKIVRRRRIPEKNVIIAEDSQVETGAYVRKIITTPEQSPEQKRGSKRKSKHVIIEDILVSERAAKKEAKAAKESTHGVEENDPEPDNVEKELPITESDAKPVRNDDEPIFEDDENFEEVPEAKRSKRSKK